MSSENKSTAIVTGGSRGIGAAVCRELASRGVHVFIGYNKSEDQANQLKEDILKKGGSCQLLKVDVTDEKDIIRSADEVKNSVGEIDLLACCAGVTDFRPLEEIDQNAFYEIFNINAFGQYKCVAEFHKLMRSGGRIVLTSSVSVRMSVRNHMLYSASKAAVECFVKDVAIELGDKGIIINAIAPGATATGMSSGNAHKMIPRGLTIELPKWKEINNACKRIANVDEMAKAYAFLLSKDVPFMTGSVMRVDGGRIC